MKHLNIKIYGRVHGVGFRWNTQHRAKVLNIVGFVRNEPDGTVYIEAEGDELGLENFLNWCRKGPWYAKVEKVDVEETPTKGYNEFVIATDIHK